MSIFVTEATNNQKNNTKIDNDDLSDFYDVGMTEDFKTVIEDHLNYLKNLNDTQVYILEQALVYRYEYDFYKILTAIKVDKRLHWVTLRMNGRINPFEKCSNLSTILIPSFSSVSELLNTHRTKTM